MGEIADDIDRAERAIVKASNKVVKAAITASGKTIDEEAFDDEDAALVIKASDGSELCLADLAAELRAIAQQAR